MKISIEDTTEKDLQEQINILKSELDKCFAYILVLQNEVLEIKVKQM